MASGSAKRAFWRVVLLAALLAAAWLLQGPLEHQRAAIVGDVAEEEKNNEEWERLRTQIGRAHV